MGTVDINASSSQNPESCEFSFEQHYVFLSGHIVNLSEPLPIFKDLMTLGKLSSDAYLKLELALQEAIANAVEHGNLELSSNLREEFDEKGNDRYSQLKEERLKDNRYASRFVFVSAYADAKELKIVVRDEGRGFKEGNKEGTRVVETDVELPRCSGRGLILIRAAADSVKFNDIGNELEFTKHFD